MVKTSQHTAKVPHTCAMCGQYIHKGDEYIKYFDPDDRSESKLHLHCDAVWDQYCTNRPEEAAACEDSLTAVTQWLNEVICERCDRNNADARLCSVVTCPRVLKAVTPPQCLSAVLNSAGWGGEVP